LALAGVLERVDRATEATSSNHDSRNTARCLSRLGSSTLTSMADSTAEYLAGIDQQLREIIRRVGVDRFTRRELDGMQDQAARAFDRTTNLPSVPWQSRLLGYVD
jgi:hypothetical protein